MAVLTAIAIPVFTTQLEKSREATDLSNIRSAYAEAMADYLANGGTSATSAKVTKVAQKTSSWQMGAENAVLQTRVNGSESSATIPATNLTGWTVTVTTSGECSVTETTP